MVWQLVAKLHDCHAQVSFEQLTHVPYGRMPSGFKHHIIYAIGRGMACLQ